MGKVTVLWFLLFLLLSGCGDQGLVSFMDESQPPPLKVLMAEDGSIFSPGESLTLEYFPLTESETPDAAEFEFFNESGQAQFRVLRSGVTLGSRSVTPISLSEIFPSYKKVPAQTVTGRVRLIRERRILYERTFSYFLSPLDLPEISVTTHPQEVYPGSSVFLEADTVVSGSPDSPSLVPYIQWRYGENVIKEGLLSPETARLLWTAPEAEGLYLITLAMFPVPPGKDSAVWTPTQRVQTQVIVTAHESYDPKEFQPDESHTVLYHFRGNTRNSGELGRLEYSQTLVGKPELDLQDDFLGYNLDGTSAIVGDIFPFPLGSEKQLMPFSTSFRLWKRADGVLQKLFSAQDAATEFRYSLEIDSSNRLTLEVSSGRQHLRSSMAGLLTKNELHLITVSLVPFHTGLRILWYLDGVLLNEEVRTLSEPFSFSGAGSYQLGAQEQGFVGMIDEFGIYFQDEKQRSSIDGQIYHRSMMEKWGASLEWAQGFDGFFLPDDYVMVGDYVLERGSLTLFPGARLLLPVQYPGNPGWDIWIPFHSKKGDEPHTYYQIFLESEPDPILSVDLKGGLVFPGGKRKIALQGGGLHFSLYFEPRGIRFVSGELEIILPPLGEGRGLFQVIENGVHSSAPVVIPEILITRKFQPQTRNL